MQLLQKAKWNYNRIGKFFLEQFFFWYCIVTYFRFLDLKYFLFCCHCSVTQSWLTLCNPMDSSMPGFPVLNLLPEFAQTHVHRVNDAIKPSHPLLSPSPPVFNLSQHQGLFNESTLPKKWPNYWTFSFSISPSSE